MSNNLIAGGKQARASPFFSFVSKRPIQPLPSPNGECFQTQHGSMQFIEEIIVHC